MYNKTQQIVLVQKHLFTKSLLINEWVNVFFWYRLTWVVPNKIRRAVKQLCVLLIN